jgi:hypothetical protein
MDNGVTLNEVQKKSQRARSLAIGCVLVGFVVLIYIGTWYKFAVHMTGNS